MKKIKEIIFNTFMNASIGEIVLWYIVIFFIGVISSIITTVLIGG